MFQGKNGRDFRAFTTRIIVVKAINLLLGFIPYTLNEREHLRMVTRLRIWGRSSESFAREWDRGGRFDGLPELAIPGRGHADFSLEGFAKGHF